MERRSAVASIVVDIFDVVAGNGQVFPLAYLMPRPRRCRPELAGVLAVASHDAVVAAEAMSALRRMH